MDQAHVRARDLGLQRREITDADHRQAHVRARDLGLPVLDLETRVELSAIHAIFRALGFVEAGRRAHPGYDRPTSILFRRAVA